MRLYLDDVRATPASFDIRAYTAPEAISILKGGHVTFISLDHDLDGDGEGSIGETGTGYDVALWIEENAASGAFKRIGWAVHSMNPSGAAKIRQAMTSAERYWLMNENT